MASSTTTTSSSASTLALRPPVHAARENASTSALISTLSLAPHPEGGYFAVTHVNRQRVPSPFDSPELQLHTETRSASSQIHYLLTPHSPIGHFHRNKALTYHLLHRGRGRYVLIHEDGRVEDFVVGPDVAGGERLQWIVEGGVWKCSFFEEGEEGLLISEVVVPGFEYQDHEFMMPEQMEALLGKEQTQKWSGFLKDPNDEWAKDVDTSGGR